VIDLLREHHLHQRFGWRALEVAMRVHANVRRITGNVEERIQLRTAIGIAKRGPAAEVPVFVRLRETPRVVVVIPVTTSRTLSPRCLWALRRSTLSELCEVIVVTDGRSALPAGLSESTHGIRILHQDGAADWPRLANAGAETAGATYIAFLRPDTLVLPNWLEALLDAVDDPQVGLAGTKSVRSSRRLNSIGGTVWGDGSATDLGRGRDPLAPEYMFRLDVDFCADAAFLVREEILRAIGWFDEGYSSARESIIDLCLRIREYGYRVVVEPSSVVQAGAAARPRRKSAHEQAATEPALDQKAASFHKKWGDHLDGRIMPPSRTNLRQLIGSDRNALPRVLVCDQVIPAFDRDAGGHRMDWILRTLAPMASRITLVPELYWLYLEYADSLRHAGVEVIVLGPLRPSTTRRFLKSRAGLYDLVIMSRPFVAEKWLDGVTRFMPRAVTIFDTVDLHSLRVEREVATTGSSSLGPPAAVRALETQMVQRTDITATVTEAEELAVHELSRGSRTVVLPTVHDVPDEAPPDFARRYGLLFIGSFYHPPNADAVAWFARDVLPIIRQRVPLELTVVGAEVPPSLPDRCGPHVHFAGWVPHVEPLFDAARVFVAPLRYGAGMKGKIGQALALGLPIVTTTIGVEGMNLVDGHHILIRDDSAAFAEAVLALHADAKLWSQLSQAGRVVTRERWSPAAMKSRLEHLLSNTVGYPDVYRDYADGTRPSSRRIR
jgi:glycosyltransferase involved in cell wall biosynthesis/GT2 family glycosyltransferase